MTSLIKMDLSPANISEWDTPFLHKTPAILGHALLSVSFVLLYLLFTRPEVIIISHIGLVAWYPATGLALALMLAINPRYVFLVCFADALAGVVLYHQPLWSYSLTIGSFSVAVFYAGAAYWLRGSLVIDLGLRHRRDVVRYVVVTTIAALGATVISTVCLAADHSIVRSEYWQSALAWFFGDEIGLLGVAPFLLIHVSPWVRRQLSLEAEEPPLSKERPRRTSNIGALFETGAQAATLVSVLWIVFGPGWDRPQPFYLIFVPIIWIAMRQGIRGVVTGLLVSNFGIVIALQFYPLAATLVKVGLLMFVVSAVGLIVGSAVSERHRMAIDLLEQTTYLNSLIQNSPLGIVVLNDQGGIELTNSAFKKLFLYGRSELAGKGIYDLFPAEGEPQNKGSQNKNEKQPKLPEMTFTGQGMSKSIRRQRRDGTILNLELHTVPVIANGHPRGSYTIYQDVS